jgi:hypothetical protein
MPKFLALYLGTPDNQPAAPPDEQTIARGMAAWQGWMAQHASAIVDGGGPLGKTKKAAKAGISDTRNNVAGYVIVEAASQDAAVKLFENHPHFAIFPGDSVEVMECLPIPGA